MKKKKKKIAVVVRNRQDEALRMSLGIILMDDEVDVYVLDRKVDDTEANRMNVETMLDMDMNLFSNCRDNADLQFLSTKDIGQRLPHYDIVLPY